MTHTAVIPHGRAGQASAILAGLDLRREEQLVDLPAGVTVTPDATEPRWYVVAGLPDVKGAKYKLLYPSAITGKHFAYRWPNPPPSQVTIEIGQSGHTATSLGAELFLDGVRQGAPTLAEDAEAHYIASGWSIDPATAAGDWALVWSWPLAVQWYEWHWTVAAPPAAGDVRWTEGDEEAADALRDLYDDGEPVTVRYKASYVAEGDVSPTIIPAVDIQTHAHFRAFTARERAAAGVSEAEIEVWLPHGRRGGVALQHAGQALTGLGALQDAILSLPVGRTPQAASVTVYQHEEPLTRTDYPTPGGANVRPWDVLSRTEELRDAGVPVLHKMRARA